MVIVKDYKKPENISEKIKSWSEPDIPERGVQILEARYLMKDDEGKVCESVKELFYRVAHVIASVDSVYNDFNSEESEKKFYELMTKGFFLPNSPALRGAGLNINLSACYVLPVEDSREGIFRSLREAVEIQAFGGGTGFNFSKLRPRGSLIKSTKGVASGPISFMEIFDLALGKTIAQGGTRQGANMGILDYNHPDVEEFIKAKNKEGKLRNFNISVGVTEDFIKKVLNEEKYELINHKGEIVKVVNAKEIFDKIVQNAWQSGDPGLIFLDRIERDNATPEIGKIESTNPCGEQPLLPYEVCNLGSINLKKFVEGNSFNFEKLGEVVFDAVHYLDNVIDVNTYPLEKIEKMAKANRKIGLGVMGFADTLINLGIAYGSDESYEFAEKIMSFINQLAKQASVKLAETRGEFPNWEKSIFNESKEYFKGENLKIRNAARTTIAPTGTLSNIAGVEGGIEPIFAIAYKRRSVFNEEGKAKFDFFVINSDFEKIAKQEGFYSEELLEEICENKGSLKNVKKPENISDARWNELKKIFVTSHDLDFEQHIKMQARFQRFLDSAVSKTINLPNSASVEDVRKAYLLAYELGVKGITIYRDGCKSFQVLAVPEKEIKHIRPELIGTTVKQITPHGTAFITLNVEKKNPANPYEVFINIGKGRRDIGAISEGIGRLASLIFKSGVSLDELLDQIENIPGETQVGLGPTKICSLPDAFAKGLREAYSQLNKNVEIKTNQKNISSGNLCPDCGNPLYFVEGCQKCNSCGYSRC